MLELRPVSTKAKCSSAALASGLLSLLASVATLILLSLPEPYQALAGLLHLQSARASR
jgi:hypothetical protein